MVIISHIICICSCILEYIEINKVQSFKHTEKKLVEIWSIRIDFREQIESTKVDIQEKQNV